MSLILRETDEEDFPENDFDEVYPCDNDIVDDDMMDIAEAQCEITRACEMLGGWKFVKKYHSKGKKQGPWGYVLLES